MSQHGVRQAVLMVGGKGTRLLPLTENKPKPMLSVCDRPCIWYLIRSMARAGIEEVILGCGYKPGMMEALGDGRDLGVNIVYSYENEPRGTAGAMKIVQDRMDGTFVAANGDVFADLDVAGEIARHIETGEEHWLEAPLFADCTGDATIGVLAGADWRMGREGRDEFGESLAPEKADKLTMGASVQWYSVDTGHRTSFPEFDYGVEFNEDNCEKVTMGEWTWETGMNYDQIADAERVRDYGMMVIYSNWSFLKNHKKDNAKWQDRDLEWVAYIAGKRESRRLMGDYILKQDDIDKDVFHEDASFTTTWSIDLHFPDKDNSAKFPGAEFKAATVHNWIHPYAVPYRCLYSRNVDNLLMAGRNISTTHVGLGTTRVMRTTGMMGEVVGMAAGICTEYGCSPRDVYQDHLDELKTLMKKGLGKETGSKEEQRFNLPNKLLEKPKAFIE